LFFFRSPPFAFRLSVSLLDVKEFGRRWGQAVRALASGWWPNTGAPREPIGVVPPGGLRVRPHTTARRRMDGEDKRYQRVGCLANCSCMNRVVVRDAAKNPVDPIFLFFDGIFLFFLDGWKKGFVDGHLPLHGSKQTAPKLIASPDSSKPAVEKLQTRALFGPADRQVKRRSTKAYFR
jgi:hypothetical protein